MCIIEQDFHEYISHLQTNNKFRDTDTVSENNIDSYEFGDLYSNADILV